MFGRLSSNALFKSVIAIMAATVVLVLAANAWESWQRLATARRIADVADASGFAFKAMHNLRTDRATTVRGLNDPEPADAEVTKRLDGIRADEMPALKAAQARLATISFADDATLLPALEQSFKTWTALQAESRDALTKPKTARRDQLGKEYMAEASALLELLDKVSARLTAAVKLNDPLIDQLLAIKQLAWLVRNAGGDASLLVSNGIAAGKIAPDGPRKYAAAVGGSETAWAATPTPTRP